jgi:hypothetical protein
MTCDGSDNVNRVASVVMYVMFIFDFNVAVIMRLNYRRFIFVKKQPVKISAPGWCVRI